MSRSSFRSGRPRSGQRSTLGLALGLGLVLALTATACRQDMHDAAKYEPLEKSAFFEDQRASRQLVAGTIPRGHLQEDKLLYTGRDGDALSESFPFPVTAGVMKRGQERFNIYCSPCHARTGDGDGMIVQRGYKQPPSLHEERVRVMPAGYFFQVMTNGFATMPSYAAQIGPEDRWAIAAYVKALQASRQVQLSDLTAEEKKRLEADEAEPEAGSQHGGGHGSAGQHGQPDKETHGG